MLVAASYIARTARCGPSGLPRPREALGAPIWNTACDTSFEAFGDSRPPGQCHTVLDALCSFDALLEKRRVRDSEAPHRTYR